jgi:hypothetical protein
MSNYLENLIAKSFNRLEIARPRLASRFEPLALGASQPAGDSDAAEMPEAETAPNLEAYAQGQNPQASKNSELHRDRHLTAAKRLPEAPETSEWRGNQQLPELEPPALERPILRPQPAPPKNSAPQAAPQSPKAPDPAHQLPEPTLQAPEPRRLRQIETDSRFQETPEQAPNLGQKTDFLKEQPQEKIQVIVPGPLQNAPLAIRRPVNESQAEPPGKAAKVAYLPFARQTDRADVQPRAALRFESQQAAESLRQTFAKSGGQAIEAQLPPTINVTIGRIEVRATTPQAAQPRRSKPAAPTMSLEEYLRRRDRGGGK